MTEWRMLILLFITTNAVHPAQPLTGPLVYQPDKELRVNIGDSATLGCCISEGAFGIIHWFKQPNKEKPQIVVTSYRRGGDALHVGSLKTRIKIERSPNCFNLTISDVVQSDEAMYYCALPQSEVLFADGTYLQIKVCAPTPRGITNVNTQRTTDSRKTDAGTTRALRGAVFGLAAALGLCALLIFFLIMRRKCKNFKASNSMEDSSRKREEDESEAESVNYAALKFSKRKPRAGERSNRLSEECVHADVKRTTVQYRVDT